MMLAQLFKGFVVLSAAGLVAVAALPSGCSSGPSNCSTNSEWTKGDEESPLMHPGDDCIACHSQGEGPRFLVAGTVMKATDDDIDCNGVSGITVRITDANGQVIDLQTNAAGNFYLEPKQGSIATPYKAKVIKDGQEREMTAEQTDGACASCHTAEGKNGAPGRILPPG